MEETIGVFLSYASQDQPLRDELLQHLAPLSREKLISIWHRGEIGAGTDWQRAIDTNLEAAPLILLLISSDFLASGALYSLEMQRAVERHDASEARVIPIILRPADWQNAPFSKLLPLPLDGKPVSTWEDRDTAWLAVTQGIREVVKDLRSQARKIEGQLARLPEVPESAKVIAKRTITFLEDQRILYDPYIMENAEFCIASAERMRRFFTEQLSPLSLPDDLKNTLREMRSACRKFMQDVIILPGDNGLPTLDLIEALEELRATLGKRVARLAVRYQITDIDKGLASVLPVLPENESAREVSSE